MADEDNPVEAAEARRERLRALRQAQELLNTPDEEPSQAQCKNEDGETTNDESVNMKFRNYLPHDKQLQEGKLAPPDLPKFEDSIAAAPVTETKEDPFLNIAPKKPNWDLKRDVEKKLDKLERKTQKALYKLMDEQQKQQQLEDGNVAAIED